jgi:hypothetical protein
MTEGRVPDAVQRSSRCSAEPGPYQTPPLVTAPALQRTASRRATRLTLRQGHALHEFGCIVGADRGSDFLTGSLSGIRIWLLETFPALQNFG